MAPSATYDRDERSKANRLAKRTNYDADQIHTIINTTPILHVSFNAPLKDGPPFPTILPMLGAMGTYASAEEPSIYLHGSSVARLFKLTSGGETEIPLCVAATLMDGYVLALAPFHNSCNYRSAVVFGYGTTVTDPEEVAFAFELITDNTIPSRWKNSRNPATEAETNSTAILRVRIETASAKVRAGGPHDDRADLRNEELTSKTWTGVVPTYVTLGEPVASAENRMKGLPEYLSDWVADVNSLNEQRAIDAMDEPQ